MTVANEKPRQAQGLNKRRLVRFLLALPVYFALFLFLPAGTWAWTRGWLFIGVFLGTLAVAFWYLWRVNPDVVVAHSGSPKGSKRWDKILLGFFLPAVYAIVPVAALDAGRLQWLPVPWWVCGIGYLVFLVSMGLVTWAEAVKPFFEVTVRIQTERDHQVIATGPYALVHHPGYVAGCLCCLGTALCLGSL